MTVGHDIRQWKLRHARCLCSLDNPYEGNVMGSHGIKFYFQMIHIRSRIMLF